MKKNVLLLILTLCTLYSWGATVTINGKQLPSTGTTTLTSQNTGYGITDGSIIFDAAANTLTLKTLKMSVSNHAIAVSSPTDFKILIYGSNTINVNGACYGINMSGVGNYTITSDSSVPQPLSINVTNGNPASAPIRAGGRSLTIDYCNLVLSGPDGLRGNDNPLTLKDANIKSTGSESGSIHSFSSITFDGCKCQTYSFNSSLGGIASGGSLVKSLVYIYREYPVQVYGKQVTDLNKNDILGDGKVTYSEYSYAGGVISLLDGADITAYSSYPIFFSPNAKGAHILVKGKAKLTGTGSYSAIYARCPLTVYSTSSFDASLNLISTSNKPTIVCEYRVEFSGIDATLDGFAGIKAENSTNATLTFRNSNVNINATGTYGAIYGFNSVEFENCHITNPTSVTLTPGRGYTNFSIDGLVKSMVIKKGTDNIVPTIPYSNELSYNEYNTDETSVTLTWNSAEDNLTKKSNLKYHVYVKEGTTLNGTWNQSFDLPKGSTSTTFTNLKPGTTYTIRVKVMDEAGNYTLYKDKVITTPEATVAYDLWIEDTQVTNKNCNNLYSGLAQYNPKNNTLTLNSCWFTMSEKGYDYPIVNHIDQLHIKVEHNCGLMGWKGGIYSTGQLIIEGDGISQSKLSADNTDTSYPIIHAENGLSIENCEITTFNEKQGIEGDKELRLTNSKVTCKNIRGFERLHFVGTYIKTPRGGEYDETNRILDGGDGKVMIDVRKTYDLRIAGIDVNSDNENDVLGDGTVRYDDVDKVLYLNNANLVYENEVILNDIYGLRIRLIGDNVLVSRYGGCIDSNSGIVIEGYTPSHSKLTLFQYTSEGKQKGSIFLGSGLSYISNCTIDGSRVIKKGEYDAEINIQKARIDMDNFEGFRDIRLNNSRLANREARFDTEQRRFVTGGSGDALNPISILAPTFVANGINIYPGDDITTSQGTATYDAETSTLTLKDAHLGNMAFSETLLVFDDLTIRLEGDNTIEAASGALIPASGDLTIEGPGTLTLNAPNMAFTIWGNTHTTYGLPQNITLKNTKVNINCDGYASWLDATDFHILNSDFTVKAEDGNAAVSWHSLELVNSIMIEPTLDIVNGNPISYYGGKYFIIQACGTVGDLDGNGILTPADVTLMIRYLKGVPAGVNTSDLDIDGDGRFTKKDIDALVNILLGK